MGRRTRYDLLRGGFLEDVEPPAPKPSSVWKRPPIFVFKYLWPEGLPCLSCGRDTMRFFVLYEKEAWDHVPHDGVGYPSCPALRCTRKLKTDLLAWDYRRTLESQGTTIWDHLKPRYAKRVIPDPFRWDWSMEREWRNQHCPQEYLLCC